MHWDFGEHCCNQVDYLPCKTTSLWTGVGVSTKGVCSSHPLGFDLRSLASGFGCTINGSRRFFLCFFSRRALCGIKKSRKQMGKHIYRGRIHASAIGNDMSLIRISNKPEIFLQSLTKILDTDITVVLEWDTAFDSPWEFDMDTCLFSDLSWDYQLNPFTQSKLQQSLTQIDKVIHNPVWNSQDLQRKRFLSQKLSFYRENLKQIVPRNQCWEIRLKRERQINNSN